MRVYKILEFWDWTKYSGPRNYLMHQFILLAPIVDYTEY